MTYDQIFQWCFEHDAELHFHATNGKREVSVIHTDYYETVELLGTGKTVMAAIQDAVQGMRKQEVSA